MNMMVSSFSSVVRRFASAACAGLALAGAFTVSEARADYTFNLGTLFVDDDPDTGAVLLSGIPAGTYTSYEVSTDWEGVSGFPYSSEAVWALSNESPLTASALFYASPGSASNSFDDELPATLNWSGNLTTAYTGGNLYFLTQQTYFTPSTANWNNTVVTLKTDPIVFTPPTSTSLTLPMLGSLVSGGELSEPNEVDWFSFTYNGGTVTFDTFGSNLTGDVDDPNDTEIGLYDALGAFTGLSNDDAASGVRPSRLTVDESDLTTGETYYLAVSGFNAIYTPGFGVTSDSSLTGTYRLNVTVAPEAGTNALLGLGGLLGAGVAVVARRRAKTV